MPSTTLGPRRTRHAVAAAAWDRLQASLSSGEPGGWFKEQAGLRGLEAWPDVDGNLWALNGDPEEDSADAHPGLTLAAPLRFGEPTGPSRGLMLALAVVDVLNQLGFEPEMPVSLLAQVGPLTSVLPAEALRRVELLIGLTDADGAVPALAVADTAPIGQIRELVVAGEPAGGHDPLLTFAMTVLAVAKQARLAGAAPRTTNVRVNGADALDRPTRLQADVAVDGPDADAVFATIERQARERADRDGTELAFTRVDARPDLAARCAAALGLEPTSPVMAARPTVGPPRPAGPQVATIAVATGAEAPSQVVAVVQLVEALAG